MLTVMVVDYEYTVNESVSCISHEKKKGEEKETRPLLKSSTLEVRDTRRKVSGTDYLGTRSHGQFQLHGR